MEALVAVRRALVFGNARKRLVAHPWAVLLYALPTGVSGAVELTYPMSRHAHANQLFGMFQRFRSQFLTGEHAADFAGARGGV
jgi:hypothetical protein